MRFLLLILLIPGALRASEDPLLARLSQPMKKGAWDFDLGLSQYSRDLWNDAEGKPAYYQGHYLGITDPGGEAKFVKGFRFELRALWQAGAQSQLELSLPYYFQQFSIDSIDPSGIYLASAVNDPDVSRGDGMGDIGLGLRQVLTTFGPGRLGANLQFNFPTGVGPFSASYPLVATGSGSFGMTPAVELELAGGDWNGWLQLGVPLDFGANVDGGSGVFDGFVPGTQALSFLPPGPAFARRDPGEEADLGLGYTWSQSETTRHRLLLELSAKNEGALRINGSRSVETAQQSLLLVPQASFSYLSSIKLTLGWQLPPLWATNQAVAYWGEFLLRADYAP